MKLRKKQQQEEEEEEQKKAATLLLAASAPTKKSTTTPSRKNNNNIKIISEESVSPSIAPTSNNSNSPSASPSVSRSNKNEGKSKKSSTTIPLPLSLRQQQQKSGSEQSSSHLSPSSTEASSPSPSPSAPLLLDARNAAILTTIQQFEPQLIARLNEWKAFNDNLDLVLEPSSSRFCDAATASSFDHSMNLHFRHVVKHAVIQVTAPNACGIVRLLPLTWKKSLSASEFEKFKIYKREKEAKERSAKVSSLETFPSLSGSNNNINSKKETNNSKNKITNTSSVPLPQAIDLPASANLSRSIIAVIMHCLEVTTRMGFPVARIICHDFSEFSHPSTLHNANSMRLLSSLNIISCNQQQQEKILSATNNNNTQNILNDNIEMSKFDAFFAAPCVSPMMLYGNKIQTFVKQAIVQQQQQQNSSAQIATYKVIDLVHDNKGLNSLIYPEQWIYALCYFVAEVLMLFDSTNTSYRIRHAEKAISVFPGLYFGNYKNNNNENEQEMLYGFAQLRSDLLFLSDLENFSKEPRHPYYHNNNHRFFNNNNNENNSSSLPARNSDFHDVVSHLPSRLHHGGASHFDRNNNVERLLCFLSDRLSRVANGKFIPFAEFFRTICELPLGFIPIDPSAAPTAATVPMMNNNKSNNSEQQTEVLPIPPATPSTIGGASSIFYGFPRFGTTYAENGNHHLYHKRVYYSYRAASSSTSRNDDEDYECDDEKNNAASTFSASIKNNNTFVISNNSPLKFSPKQAAELRRWSQMGVQNCVIHVFGNETKRVFVLTPIDTLAESPSPFLMDDKKSQKNSSSAKNPPPQYDDQERPRSVSWTVEINNNNTTNTNTTASSTTYLKSIHQHHQLPAYSPIFNTSDYIAAAMTIAELEARAPCVRVIFHNLWAFRDAAFSITSMSREDPFFVSYVMSAVKGWDRLIDLLFATSTTSSTSSSNNNNNSFLDSPKSNDSPTTTTPSGTNGNNKNNESSAQTVMAENHWIGLMIKFLRASINYLRVASNNNKNNNNKNQNETLLNNALQLLYGFRSPLISLTELEEGFQIFAEKFSSTATFSPDEFFDNADSILDWLRNLLDVSEKIWKDQHLTKALRFLISIAVLPMRPTQHGCVEALADGTDLIIIDGEVLASSLNHHQQQQKNNNNYNNNSNQFVDGRSRNSHHHQRNSHRRNSQNNNNNDEQQQQKQASKTETANLQQQQNKEKKNMTFAAVVAKSQNPPLPLSQQQQDNDENVNNSNKKDDQNNTSRRRRNRRH